MTASSPMDRLQYTMEQYKLYHAHINNMFNYFLVLTGLVANAYVAAIGSEGLSLGFIPSAIGIFGFITSIILLLVHLKSRLMLDTIEQILRLDEAGLGFENGGFLTSNKVSRFWFMRHKFQFPAFYGLVAIAFFLASFWNVNTLLPKLCSYVSAIPSA